MTSYTSESLFQATQGRRIVQTTFTNYTTVTTGNTANTSLFEPSGLRGTITPLYANSTIVIKILTNFSISTGSGIAFNVYNGSYTLPVNNNSGTNVPASFANTPAVSGGTQGTASIMTMFDEPNTTGAITYTPYAVLLSTSGSFNENSEATDTNAATVGRYASQMILMELAR